MSDAAREGREPQADLGTATAGRSLRRSLMERVLVDDRSAYTARPTNPEIGDMVLVGWDAISNRMVYSVNGGPFQAVARTNTPTPTKLAMELLSTSRNAK